MKIIFLAPLFFSVLVTTGAARPPHRQTTRLRLEVFENDEGLLIKTSHRRNDPHPIRQTTVKKGQRVCLGFMTSSDNRTCAFVFKWSTKAHDLDAARLTPASHLRIYENINHVAGEQILTTQRGRNTFGQRIDLGWAYCTGVTDTTVSFRAGVWTGGDGKLKHLTCTVRLLPDGAIKVISWNLQDEPDD